MALTNQARVEKILTKSAVATQVAAKPDMMEISGLEELADSFFAAKDDEKILSKLIDSMKAMVSETVKTEYNNLNGQAASFAILGSETAGIVVSFINKFKAISGDFKSVITENLPDWQNYFKEEREVRMKDTSDASLIELKKILGKDFERFFESEVTIVAKPGLDVAQFKLPMTVRALLKQQEPTISAAKKDRR